MPRRKQSLEQKRKKDKLAKRARVAEDEDYAALVRAQNTAAHQRARSLPGRREAEQVLNTEAHRRARLTPGRREVERVSNTAAHQTARLSPGVRQHQAQLARERRENRPWNVVEDQCSKDKLEGPDIICHSCDRLFFKRSIKLVTKEKLRNCSEEFLIQAIGPHYHKPSYDLCTTCYAAISKKKFPRLNIQYSGLKFPDIDPKVTDLSPLERRLVSPRIPFMKIFALGCDRQYGIRGGVVNVPVDVPKMFSTIPIDPTDAGVIHLKLKRKSSFQHHYIYERIRPNKVYEAARVLCQTELYSNIAFNHNWEARDMEEAIFDADGTTPMDIDDQIDTVTSNPEENSIMEIDDPVEEVTEGDLHDNDQLYEETLVDSNRAVDFAPGEGQTPMSILQDEHCEELAFPAIFGGQPRNPNPAAKLSYNDIVNSEIRRSDRRAVEPEHLLYVHKKSQLQQLANSINIQIKKAAQGGMTAAKARDNNFINDTVGKDHAYRFLGDITGSPAYWEAEKKKVMAMVRQLGIPTFFVTMSAAETKWKELHRILMKTVKGIDNANVDDLGFPEIAELIRKDPVTCALYFENRFKAVKKSWSNTKEGPFLEYKIKHSYYRIEFQHRGSPHVHMLLWLEDAPQFDPSNPEDPALIDFIDSIVTTDSDHPEAQPYVQYQSHTCGRTCFKRSKGKRICRFGAPLPPMRRTRILTPLNEELSSEQVKEYRLFIERMKELLDSKTVTDFDEFLEKMNCDEDTYIRVLRSQLSSNKIFLKRSVKDTRVNSYSPKILKCMQSNIDVQFILDPYACISYIVEYINKPSRGISKLLHNCVESLKNGNHSICHQLRCVGNCFYNGTEISAQECAWCRLKLPMSKCSVLVEFINTSSSQNRHRMLKSAAELEELPDDSTDVFKPGPIDRYIKRPECMNDVCYADFIANYTFKGKGKRCRNNANDEGLVEDENEGEDEDVESNVMSNRIVFEDGYLVKRRSPKVIRFCRFDLHKDPVNFFRERLMLFKPWRDEVIELENINHEQVFKRHEELIRSNSSKYIACDVDIDAILSEAVRRSEEEETENWDNEVDPNFVNVYDYDPDVVQPDIMPDIGAHDNTAVEAKKYHVPDMLNDPEYYDLCDNLNEKQHQYLMHILSCFKSNELPIYHFISGGAGVGKSCLIKAIYQTLVRWLRTEAGEAGLPEILIAAPTGKAAFNVGGVTAHHAFSLPMVSGRKNSERLLPLGAEPLNTARVKLSKLQLIIIDEISMLSSCMFSNINDRLNQIFDTKRSSNQVFGGKSVIVVGDFQQLRPVRGNFVFEPSENNPLNHLCTVNPLWQKFSLYELTEIMRQRDDKVFAEALNRLAQGTCSIEDVKMFNKRCCTESSLPKEGKSAIRLIFTNEDVDNYNARRANELKAGAEVFGISNAVDKVTGYHNESEKQRALNNLKTLPQQQTQGLLRELTLQGSIHYMITSNISVEDGLFNGATGVLRYMLKNADGVPTTVFLEFDEPSTGKEARSKFETIIQRIPEIHPTWTPISRVKLSFTTIQKQHVKIVRDQFPLVMAEALTIHKSQGSSYNKVTVQLPNKNKRALIYVALSRATSLSGLYLLGKFQATLPDPDPRPVPKAGKKPTVYPNDEMNRLRAEALLVPKFSKLCHVPSNHIQIVSHNIRSLKNKVNTIKKDTVFQKSSLVLLQETWLKLSDPDDFGIPGKVSIARNRLSDSISKGRGTIILGKDCSDITSLGHYDRTSGEGIDITMCKYNNIYIFNIYKSTNTTMSHLEKILKENFKDYLYQDNVLVCGDFNDDLTKPSNCAVLDKYNLKLISQLNATTDRGTTIDGVFGKLNHYDHETMIYESYCSDHKPIVIRLVKKSYQPSGLTQSLQTIDL